MSDNDTVHVDMVRTFRLLRHPAEPDLTILRIETTDGKAMNFGLPRKDFLHTLKVWMFDLGAIDGAIESGAPMPGKPFGQPVKPAN